MARDFELSGQLILGRFPRIRLALASAGPPSEDLSSGVAPG
jgi:hypothetical protein